MSFVKTHLPCPECGGSDPVAVNKDGSAWCFCCLTYFKNYEGGTESVDDFKVHKNNTMNTSAGEFIELTDRDISLDTSKKYGVKAQQNTNGEILKHRYPYYIENEIAGYKVRDINTKDFKWEGTANGAGLFGQQLFRRGGKYITITEGECDAMASYELLGSKWPVVSIKSGAAGAVKDVKENLEFLETFDNIVINFDNDKAGKAAAKKIARILKPGKAKILTLPEGFKDANDMLRQNRHQNYVSSWWDAKLYTPSGVLNIAERREEFHNREKKESVPYPWSGLNKKIYGMRQGELITLTGGTGLGKSSVTREIEHWIINQTNDNVGIIALEEDWRRTVDGIMSIEANARLYIDSVRDTYEPDTLTTMFDKVFSNDRVFLHAHFGTNDLDDIFSKLRYLIVGCDCKWVVVDHLHMLVSSMTEGDERRAIDNIMTRLRSLVEETGAGVILVSHLRRVQGDKGHENGVSVSLSHLRGSNAIAQLSDCVIALERDQQAEDELEARTTRLRVLKSRYTGDVGMATALVYDKETGRLSEYSDDELLNSSTEDESIPF